ncbi:hypothetical protein NOVOSPHI9U_40254 [Novosphingobium sp. 9U]|nr:hypothetical protein NOVOSPHI9U_40254 [Novosphingobium sp. 9U]
MTKARMCAAARSRGRSYEVWKTVGTGAADGRVTGIPAQLALGPGFAHPRQQ